LTHRARKFRPVAETTLRELTGLAQRRLGAATAPHYDVGKTTKRELTLKAKHECAG
jgi:hypothetical protein